MSLNVTLTCSEPGCHNSLTEAPALPNPEQVAMTFTAMREHAKSLGWKVSDRTGLERTWTPDLCPTHARSALENFIRDTMAPLVPSIACAHDIAKALEREYFLIPKAGVIDTTLERDDFYTRPTMTVRYRQP
jgi:hypothetical protein